MKLLIWAGLAGAFIPVMAILNGRLGRVVGEGLHAPVLLFSVGLAFCVLVSLLFTKSLPNLSELQNAKAADYLGGLIVGFYVISATLLAPKIGISNFIICAVSSQILISIFIDNYGLLGAAIRPVGLLKITGVIFLLIGLTLTQLSDISLKGENLTN